MSGPNIHQLESGDYSNPNNRNETISLAETVGQHTHRLESLEGRVGEFPALQSRLSVVENDVADIKKGQVTIRNLIFSILLTIPTTLGVGVSVQIYFDGKTESRVDGELKSVKQDIRLIKTEMNQNFKDLTKILLDKKGN